MLEFRKAIHEASHAVVFESLAPGSVRSVDLILNLPQLRYGLTQLQPGSMISADSPEAASIKIRTRVVGTLAGMAGEVHYYGDYDPDSVAQDIRIANSDIRLLVCGFDLLGSYCRILPRTSTLDALEAACETEFWTYRRQADSIVAASWPSVYAVAHRLLLRNLLSGDEVRQAIAPHLTCLVACRTQPSQ